MDMEIEIWQLAEALIIPASAQNKLHHHTLRSYECSEVVHSTKWSKHRPRQLAPAVSLATHHKHLSAHFSSEFVSQLCQTQ